MQEYEGSICTFKEQSYSDGSLVCVKGTCMMCDKGKWHAAIPQPAYSTGYH